MRCARGFSLIELVIVMTIIGLLTLISLPSYERYLKKARFIEIITNVMPYKIAVALALQSGVPSDELANGMHDIPESIATKNIESITVQNGTITAKGTALVLNATYLLIPNTMGTAWQVGGTCLEKGLCRYE